MSKLFKHLGNLPQVFERKRLVSGSLPATDQKQEYKAQEDYLWRIAEANKGDGRFKKEPNIISRNQKAVSIPVTKL